MSDQDETEDYTPPAPPAPAPAPESTRLGLNQDIASSKGRAKRKSLPKRDGPIWKSVTVLVEHDTCPSVQCNNCGKKFSGGATRIAEHVTGMGAIVACTCATESFLNMKQMIIEQQNAKAEKKQQKTAAADVDAASDVKPNVTVKPEGGAPSGYHPSQKSLRQQGIKSSINAGKAEDVDVAIAEAFYGLNISPAIADKPLWKNMVTAIKSAPASYTSPDRKRLMSDLLDSTTHRLKAGEAPLREAVLQDGGTVVSDGWDDVNKAHLINFLVGNSKGMFFDGTIELKSSDAEDATHVAKLIGDEIERAGALDIVQVVTDTCSVMKAAWKLIEKRFPWITCTCCGPHVLSLELHDMAKIPEVAKLIELTGKVLNRFWGRKRWARTKLREVAEKNHGKKIGLYRAKATRFAGKVREMARVLRLKADLQQVVVTAEYAAQKWKKDDDDDEEDDADGDKVKKIILDEDGFWKPMVDALKVKPCEDSLTPKSCPNLCALYGRPGRS